MKIAIDISQIAYGTGVSVYTKELVRELLLVAPQHEYILYAGVLRRRSEIDNYLKTLTGSFRQVILPIPPMVSDLLWNKLRPFPFETILGRFDVLHTSDWTEPPSRRPKVTTIHDLSPFLYPEVTDPRIKKVFKRKISHVKEDNDYVIVPSVTIAKEVRDLNIDSSKIHIISEAPNPELFISPKMDVFKRFNIKGKYILMIGTSPRKNIERGIEVIGMLKGLGYSMVVVGNKGSNLPKGENVNYVGFVSTQELSNLYKNAELFLYPSLYEGFGLPILEANALGCPVVTSDVGSMQELSGGAILVNPYDTSSIYVGIMKALKQKTNLVHKGLGFAKKYNWKTAATETLKVYKKAYDQK